MRRKLAMLIGDYSEEIGIVVILMTMLTMLIWWFAQGGSSLWMLTLLVPAYIGAAFYGGAH